MARGGRKLKANVQREPNGRISRSVPNEARDVPPSLARRAMAAAMAMASDARCGTVIGRMSLTPEFASDQATHKRRLDAAEKWAHAYQQYVLWVVQSPALSAKAMDWGRVHGRNVGEPPSDEFIERVRAKWGTISIAIGSRGIQVLQTVMIEDRELAGYQAKLDFYAALDKLSSMWGL